MTTQSPPADADFRNRLAAPHNPLRMLVSAVGWRAVLYCFTSIVGGLLALLAAIFGVLVLPLVTWATANVERSRLVVLGLPRLTPLPRSRVRHPWDARGFSDGNLAVWGITVLFGMIDAIPGSILALLVLSLFAAVFGLVRDGHWGVDLALTTGGLAIVLIVGLYVAWALAAAQAIIVDIQLRPHSELSRQVDELTVSRRELVDVFAAERRRIEHDLHDGTQQHLMLVSMQLGEAEYALGQGDLDAARRALQSAQTSVEAATTSLRETIRGIHPQLLTDRGLVAAVRELAGRQPLGVRVEVSGDRAPDEQTALAAYYLVSEAFTNLARHAQASTATVRLELADPLLVEVYDDGVGGASVRAGHGLSGLVEWTRALGGSFWLSSPPGGPTLLRASLPNR